MSNIIGKLFQSEKNSDMLGKLNDELKVAIEDFRALEVNWNNKVKEIHGFLNGWNVQSKDLLNLKKHITIVEKISLQSQDAIDDEIRVCFKISEIIEKVIILIRNSDDTEKSAKLRLLGRISRAASTRDENKGTYSTFAAFVQQLFKSQTGHWRALKEVLQKQLHFIDVYSNEDVGVVRFNLDKFIGYLKDEGRLLGLEKRDMAQIIDIERSVRERYSFLLHHKEEELDEKRRALIQWGFDLKKRKELGDALIREWEDTFALKRATRQDFIKPLFSDAIPSCESVILIHGLKGIASISNVMRGEDVYYILKYGLPNCQKLIEKHGIVYVGNALNGIIRTGNRVHVLSLFKYGLKDFEEIMIAHGMVPICRNLLRIAQAAGDTGLEGSLFRHILESRSIVLKFGLDGLATIAEHTLPRDVSSVFFAFSDSQELLNCTELVKNSGFDDLVRIMKATNPEYVLPILTESIPKRCREIAKKHGISFLADIAELCKTHINVIFDDYLGLSQEVILKWGEAVVVNDLSKISANLDKREGQFIFPSMKKFIELEKAFGLFPVGNSLVRIIRSVNERDKYTLFQSLDILNNTSRTIEDFQEIGLMLAKNISVFKSAVIRSFFIGNVHSKAEFYKRLNEVKGINGELFHTIQGLNSMGYLCCHVTNAFEGGAAVHDLGHEAKLARSDPFNNITNDIENKFDYNPSISVIKPGFKSSIALTDKGKIGGSIGVIYDYGYIYQAFGSDISSKDKRDTTTGKVYRTEEGRLIHIRTKSDHSTEFLTFAEEPGIVVNFSQNLINELLIRKWTVSGIFFTTGCHGWVQGRLIQISRDMSGKEYINGEYWYRKTKYGIPEKIVKLFPVYEINMSNNTWDIFHNPKK